MIHQRHRRTARLTTCDRNTALCTIVHRVVKSWHKTTTSFCTCAVVLLLLVLQSTGRSHSLSANFQEVLSLMKSHNSKLCAGPSCHSRVTRRCSGLQALRSAKSARPSSSRPCDRHHEPYSEPVTESVGELTSLISQLEDEFGQLSLYVQTTFSLHKVL